MNILLPAGRGNEGINTNDSVNDCSLTSISTFSLRMCERVAGRQTFRSEKFISIRYGRCEAHPCTGRGRVNKNLTGIL